MAYSMTSRTQHAAALLTASRINRGARDSLAEQEIRGAHFTGTLLDSFELAIRSIDEHCTKGFRWELIKRLARPQAEQQG